ncbi:hypothetical protein Ancab_004517 [Ancistrocladus abbreviatus]
MTETEMGSCVLKDPRPVIRKFQARPQHEGLGAVVRRSIGRELLHMKILLGTEELLVLVTYSG